METTKKLYRIHTNGDKQFFDDAQEAIAYWEQVGGSFDRLSLTGTVYRTLSRQKMDALRQ